MDRTFHLNCSPPSQGLTEPAHQPSPNAILPRLWESSGKEMLSRSSCCVLSLSPASPVGSTTSLLGVSASHPGSLRCYLAREPHHTCQPVLPFIRSSLCAGCECMLCIHHGVQFLQQSWEPSPLPSCSEEDPGHRG